MTDIVLAARGLVKTFGSDDAQVRALNEVSVDIRRGAFTAIMGPSGSGKSTLMYTLAGLARPTSGQVFLGSTELTALKETQLATLRRDRIGFVFQAFNLLPALTADANILLPMTLAGVRPDREYMAWLVEELGIAGRLNHRPSQLSGGQQQRVAIARALLPRPDVVFADEPTGALDSVTSAEVLELMQTSSRQTGQTIVMVTHDADAARYCDEVLDMRDGQLVGVRSTERRYGERTFSAAGSASASGLAGGGRR